MTTRRRKNQASGVNVKPSKSTNDDTTKAKAEQKKKLDEKVSNAKSSAVKEFHFVPLLLQFTVLVFSGTLSILAYRDLFGTGKVIFGDMDEAMLDFTKSRQWFDESRGWKSTQGGFSAVQQITTDKNDMGSFFVRKLAGATALSFHLQKLLPIVFQPSDAYWGYGHFTPVLLTSVFGNLAIAGFYMSHLDDFKNAHAGSMGFRITIALVIESIIIMGFLLTLMVKKVKPPNKLAKKLPEGKVPKSLVSNIVARTICIITGLMALIAGRDFFFPGQELKFPPRDDIYLEWTGAFIHSPPADSEEGEENGLEAPLHIGDKFMSRLAALYLMIICFQKFVAAFLVRVGKDNSGATKCRLFWRNQAISDGLVLFTVRVFTSAAKTASLDFRWHVMCLGYELFILAIYGYC